VTDAKTHIGIPDATVTVGNQVSQQIVMADFISRKAGDAIMARAPGYRASRFKDYAFDHHVFGPFQVSEQIRAADDFGSDGWMLWNPHNRYEGLGLRANEQAKYSVSSPH
jgi:hypothetical protein